MVHRGIRSILLNRFPFVAFQIESKDKWRRLAWFAIQPDSVEIVNGMASPHEINPLITVRCPSGNPVSRCPWLSRQFAPCDFLGIVVVNLPHPALVRGNVW